MIVIRLPRSLYDRMRQDLARPHPFAAERVGFLFVRPGPEAPRQVLGAFEYAAVEDNRYLRDRAVAAMIGSDAIRAALQHAMDLSAGAFHVHVHDHEGRPSPSRIDLATYRELLPSFRAVVPGSPHGAIVLSRSHGCAHVWREDVLVRAQVSIIGFPLSIWRAS